MTSGWSKFSLLMWKNFILLKRHYIRTLVEIFAPVIFIALLVLVRSLVEPENEDRVDFDPFHPLNFTLPIPNITDINPMEIPSLCPPGLKIPLSYSPESKIIENVLKTAVCNIVKFKYAIPLMVCKPLVGTCIAIKGYENAAALQQQLVDPVMNDSSLCGIQFDDSLKDMEIADWPENVNLTLRFPAQLRRMMPPNPYLNWRTDLLFTILQLPGPRTPKDPLGGWPGYMQEGFVPLSEGILRAIIQAKNSSAKIPDFQMERFPHPPYFNDFILIALRALMPIIIMLSFNYTCINIVRVIAVEKEKQLKEVMKIMGLPNWLHWMAWFIKSLSYLLISIILIVILLKAEWYSTETGISGYSMFTFTPWHFILFYLIVYMITSICFCFMVSTWFSKANTASTVAGLLWFLSIVPFTLLSNDRQIPTLTTRLFSCLAHNTAMAFGLNIIFDNEITGQGLQWENFFTPLTTDDTFVMGHVILMLIVDAILYMLIALYIEQVFPGSYGVSRPWYFPFTCHFWKGVFRQTAAVEDIPCNDNSSNIETIEPDPVGLGVGVNIINLTKIFDKKIAVDSINLKIFEDQITVLLGHNGAGKTTTMSMLTGMFPPTSGTALVAGHDIKMDIEGVRASLGLCPQHNVLFSDLTVAEHIYFYARLKGIEGGSLNDEVDKYVKLLGLEDKRDVLSSALSGGMQRRLSVGAALCGGSRVVLLDEPTSGMDPAARRELWDLLHAEKKGRTMILTTHFMDEADILGERVAILSGGKIRCVGSPFYLKKKLGIGYRLTAVRKILSDGSYNAPSGPVTNLLKSYIPEVKLYTDIGSELSYVLPEHAAEKFPPMLKDLEVKQYELGLLSFGISASTLEEVFMRVGSDTDRVCNFDNEDNHAEMNGLIQNGDIDTAERIELSDSNFTYTGWDLLLNHTKAVFFKKILVTRYSWLLCIIQLIIPVLFISLGIIVARMWKSPEGLPARNLELSAGYPDSLSFLSYNDNVTDMQKELIKNYKEYFNESGIDTMKLHETKNPMKDEYLKMSDNDVFAMRKRYLVGMSVRDNSIMSWFSNFGFHDMPASFVLYYKALYKTLVPDISINLINHPLPFTLQTRLDLITMGDGGTFQVAFNLGFSMAFVSALFMLFYVKENVSRSKLLQLASGASPIVLWSVALIWDMLCFIIIIIAIMLTLLAFGQVGLSTGPELGRFFVVMLLFGWASLPIHYLASFLFTSPSTGFSRMILFNVFSGMAMFLVVEVLNTPGLDLEHIGKIMHYILLLFPQYTLPSGIKEISLTSLTKKNCLELCYLATSSDVCDLNKFCHQLPSLEKCCLADFNFLGLERPGVGINLIYLAFVGLFTFIMLILIEYRVQNLICKPNHQPPPPIQPTDEDDDVADERARILQIQPNDYKNYNLLTRNLTKYYKKFLAVDQLTVGIKDGECFGLLGINGAGKTTTFKMLTGDLRISCGDAWVNGYSVNDDMKTVYKNIGYCPQFDALIDEMTGRQTLKMFSLLRGIPSQNSVRFAQEISEKLGFTKHLDKKVGAYSGGNKRKLSTALALLGNPRVVYLDEPTTGMDPAAKRLVWNAISECQCVILTSHSMEECEALCSRLAIMVNGRPQCLGSTQHLKNKFSQGYTLIVKLKKMPTLESLNNGISTPDVVTPVRSVKKYSLTTESHFDTESLNNFLMEKFPDAKLMESFQGLITYYLPDVNVKWSTIFGTMEAAKEELNIEDYSIGQTSLEQIFLHFTKHQKDAAT